MKRFFGIWWELINPGFLIKTATGVPKIIPAFVIAVFGPILVGFWPEVPWWLPPIVGVLVCYLSLTAGMALILSRKPSLEIGPLCLDEVVDVFYFYITNTSPIPTKVMVKIHVPDSYGYGAEHAWEGHWRGREPGFDGTLKPYERAQYGLLKIAQLENGNPGIFIYTKEPVFKSGQSKQEDVEHGFIRVSKNVKKSEQDRVRADVIITHESLINEKVELGEPIRRTYAIDPSTRSFLAYDVLETPVLKKKGIVKHVYKACRRSIKDILQGCRRLMNDILRRCC